MLLAFCAAPLRGGQFVPPSCEGVKPFTLGTEIDSRWLAGIDNMYRLKFLKANENFKALMLSDPASPAGYLALAALSWWQFSQNYDLTRNTDTQRAEFLGYARTAIKKAETQIKANKDDASAYFMLGTAYGLIGRWYAVEHSWWQAYTNGTKGRKNLAKAVELNPCIYDAYAGLGIFNYYADTLPGALRLTALLFVHGSRNEGIRQLQLAADNGKFFATEAKLFYIGILVQFEKNYPLAIKLASDLSKSQPDNDFFRFSELLTRFNSNDWEGTLTGAQELIKIAAENKNGLNEQLALVYLAAGEAELMKDNYDAAERYFTLGITNTAYPDKGWVSYCYLRRGQLYDALGEREKALADYRIVLERDNFWDTREIASKSRKKPVTLEEMRLQMENH